MPEYEYKSFFIAGALTVAKPPHAGIGDIA